MKGMAVNSIPIGVKIRAFQLKMIIPRQSKGDREMILFSEEHLEMDANSLVVDTGENILHHDNKGSLSEEDTTEESMLPIHALGAIATSRDEVFSAVSESDSDPEDNVYISRQILRKNIKKHFEIKFSIATGQPALT
jgi:hypothetical protein